MSLEAGFLTAGRVRKLNEANDLRRMTRIARARLLDPNGYLCKPFAARNAILMPVREFVLAHWGIFSPSAPTLEFLMMAEAADGEGGLLYKQILNPFASWVVIYGLLSRNAYDNEEQALETLRDLFASNGANGFEVFTHYPTYVFGDFSQSRIGEDDLRDMVQAAGQTLTCDDLSYACDLFEQYPAQPWDRAQVVSGAKATFTRPAFSAHVASEAEYARWWRIATSKAHVDAEAKASLKAWNDTIDEQKRAGRLSMLTLTRWSDVLWFLESVKWN
jgi:hypothetical protein